MEELIIPNPSQHDVASFNILLNGAAMDASYEVLSISIDKEINRIPTAKIVLKDGDASLANFEISNKADFVPGTEIVIKIGFDSKNNQAFKGIITKHIIKVKESGDTQLLIECKDVAVRMTVGRHSHYFLDVKDSEVFDLLINNYKGLKGDITSTNLKHKELVQHHLSNWDFMLLRAEANGMLVNVDDGKIQINKPDTTSDPVLQVSYGSSVIEFEAEMDARNQLANVEAVSWDYTNQQLFKANVSETEAFTQHGNITGSELSGAIQLDKFELNHSGHLLEQELKDWVEGTMLRSRLGKIRGRAKITGFAGIKPGNMLKLTGVGNRFNGNAYVTAVKQDMGDGTWYTQIQFGLDPQRYSAAYNNVNDFAAAGLIGSISGLQIAKVVQLGNDPDGEDRILVKIPVIDDTSNGTWIRVACLDAGSNRGSFFRPEINDEVIVGFINDDPRHGVMLGMLNSSAKPAPLSAKDENGEKGFFTRSKMRIHINDDTKTITIDTPAGNSIQLDEDGAKIEIKDQNSNKITMSTSGISLESPKSIDIKAGSNLTLSAGASLTIGGSSLSVKADASLGLEGAATKISSSGITEISGSLVKIN
jgi:Rhs element Vgr protein